MRGEHANVVWSRVICAGSSPHARGTPERATHEAWGRRFIPACAGNTQTWSGRGSSAPVHPRMRGEHDAALQPEIAHGGSSPHARGTRADRREGRSKRRFIPACAGNTSMPGHTPCARPVHPRMRGEHQSGPLMRRGGGGSSPHARGTLSPLRPPLGGARFIPACAGNTLRRASPLPKGAVHPRMRGEHVAWGQPRDQLRGSSPHARGTLTRSFLEVFMSRFIPACAGNTLVAAVSVKGPAVHPRMRGEHALGVSRSR
ncbi:hypothetical protein J2T32_002320 [Kerstersia gyiorum]|nr:hypothetical protein [Kerstersia gyiorum]MCP1718669.1 hypothetical protein [Kerstersia gyiorum]